MNYVFEVSIVPNGESDPIKFRVEHKKHSKGRYTAFALTQLLAKVYADLDVKFDANVEVVVYSKCHAQRPVVFFKRGTSHIFAKKERLVVVRIREVAYRLDVDTIQPIPTLLMNLVNNSPFIEVAGDLWVRGSWLQQNGNNISIGPNDMVQAIN